MGLFVALLRKLATFESEEIEKVEKELSKVRTALAGSQNEARAAWAAVERMQEPPLWSGQANQVILTMGTPSIEVSPAALMQSLNAAARIDGRSVVEIRLVPEV